VRIALHEPVVGQASRLSSICVNQKQDRRDALSPCQAHRHNARKCASAKSLSKHLNPAGILGFWQLLCVFQTAAILASERAVSERWAFGKLSSAPPPNILQTNWPINDIDRFILARLEATNLRPSAFADKRTLLRRVTFDLVGLSPTPDELAGFQADSSPLGYEKVVDRLLDSPHFGERWARHWLDVVRFGESHGFERNTFRPNAWRYRDWVIQSFNDDLPYHEFVRLQLAGDVLSPDNPAAIIAAAYLTAGPHDILGSDAGTEAMKAATREDELEDVVGNLGQTFLGLTIQCARCHDHKYDPIPQKEYYQIATCVGGVWPGGRETVSDKAHSLLQKEREALTAGMQKLRTRLALFEANVRPPIERDLHAKVVKTAEEAEMKARAAVAEAQLKIEEARTRFQSSLESEKEALKKQAPKASENLASKTSELAKAKTATATAREAKPRASYGMIIDRLAVEQRSEYKRLVFAISHLEMRARLFERGTVDGNVPRPAKVFHVLQRGDFRKPAEAVVPAGIAAIAGPITEFGLAADSPETERRRKLADWITDARNPLLARVIVNRLWHYHFGVGLVDTPNDFGANGGRPSHPELLDWLAGELIRNGWSLKKLHRLIVTSATYRQPSQANADALAKDRDNRLLSRMNMRRLEAETIRDTILSISGELNPEMGGPSFHDFEPEKSGDNTAYSFVNGFNSELNRRAIYRRWVRRANHPLLDPLDCADPSISIPRRTITTTPVQALALLNNSFMSRAAGAFALRLTREAGYDAERQIEDAYRLAFLRGPTHDESTSSQRFVAEHGLTQFCLVVLNSNEFLYAD